MRRNRHRPRATVPGVIQSAVAALALLACASLPTTASAAGPQEAIRHTVTAVASVLDDPALQGSDKKVARRSRVATIIHGAFNFEDMGRESLGSRWAELTPAQREEFTRLFGDLFERSYSLLVLRFLGERTTDYVEESIDGRRALVRTQLVSDRDGKLPVEYRLTSLDGRWQVIDVVVDGVSLVTNYRVQFSKIIRNSSYETLLARMRKQVE